MKLETNESVKCGLSDWDWMACKMRDEMRWCDTKGNWRQKTSQVWHDGDYLYRLLKVKDFSTKSTSISEVKIDFLNAWLGAVESSGQQLLSIVHSILSISFFKAYTYVSAFNGESSNYHLFRRQRCESASSFPTQFPCFSASSSSSHVIINIIPAIIIPLIHFGRHH